MFLLEAKASRRAHRYIRRVAELARINPELIHLLRLSRGTKSILPYEQKENEELVNFEKPILKTTSSSQTVTHPVTTNIVHSYEWNEWQLRRLAIKLVNVECGCGEFVVVIDCGCGSLWLW